MLSKLKIQQLKNKYWHLPKAIFANILYGFPSRKLTLIGVTGTDGKTSTSTLIFQSLNELGIDTGLISTIEAKIGDDSFSTGLHTTTPDPLKLQKMLRTMVNSGLTHAVIEVTAHALDQYRVWGLRFQTSIVTNVSHEHLDDFVTMDNYITVKSLIGQYSETVILNRDDEFFTPLKRLIKSKIHTLGKNPNSNFHLHSIKKSQENLSFKINNTPIHTDSTFDYQVYNIGFAYAVLSLLKLNTEKLIDLVTKFPTVRGRRQEVSNDDDLKLIVDFAHTPNALAATLSSLNPKGRLFVIFGATGGRDQSKRPLMGAAVAKHANVAFVTSDDTRHENIEQINQMIISGFPKNSKSLDAYLVTKAKDLENELKDSKTFAYFNIPDRQSAFNLALKLSLPGDTIIACGKGHEDTILHGDTEYPWSETEAFRTALSRRFS